MSRVRLLQLLTIGLAAALALLVVAVARDDDNESGEDGADGGETQAMLLNVDDVDGATGAEDADDLAPATFCSPVGRAESRLRSYAGGEFSVREIAVDSPAGEVTVETAVFDVQRPAVRSILFTSGFELGVETCSAEPLARGEQTESMTPLEGLPDGVVGFSSTVTGGGDSEQVARAYAMVQTYVIVVGARRTGEQPLDVPIADLMATAIAKVEGAVARQDA